MQLGCPPTRVGLIKESTALRYQVASVMATLSDTSTASQVRQEARECLGLLLERKAFADEQLSKCIFEASLLANSSIRPTGASRTPGSSDSKLSSLAKSIALTAEAEKASGGLAGEGAVSVGPRGETLLSGSCALRAREASCDEPETHKVRVSCARRRDAEASAAGSRLLLSGVMGNRETRRQLVESYRLVGSFPGDLASAPLGGVPRAGDGGVCRCVFFGVWFSVRRERRGVGEASESRSAESRPKTSASAARRS